MDRRLCQLVCFISPLFFLEPSQAAFFQLVEISPAGLGNAFAGGSAIAEDASTVWSNPAGLTRLSRTEYLVGIHAIVPTTEARGTNGTALTTAPIGGGNGGNAGESAVIPNFYVARRVNDRTVVGFGVNVPFGLATEYDAGWVGRYHATRSEIKTVNLNPGIGYQLNDQWSIGGGINFQKFEAELSQAVDFATICTVSAGGAFSGACGAGAGFLTPGSNDGNALITADDQAWGANVGLLWQFQEGARLGIAYRSKIKFKLAGFVDMKVPANVPPAFADLGGFVDSGISAYIDVPATLSLSLHHRLGRHWEIMGDVTRSYWSDLPELRIDFDSAQPDSVVTLGLKNVNRYALGTTYRPDGAWAFRVGAALDETPTPDESLRTPRLPDENRHWFALGADYRHNNDLSFAMALVHIRIDDARLVKIATPTNENASRGNLSAEYAAKVNIVSAQARWTFN